MNLFMFRALLVLVAVFDMAPVNAEDCIDMEKNAMEIQKCCDVASPLEMENIKTCKEKYEQELAGDMSNMIACIFECHAAELGVADGSEVHEDKMLEIANQIEDPAIREVAIPVIKDCFGASSEMAKTSEGHNLKCNPLAYLITECIMRGIYANCPDSHWAKSDICDQIKAGAKPCA